MNTLLRLDASHFTTAAGCSSGYSQLRTKSMRLKRSGSGCRRKSISITQSPRLRLSCTHFVPSTGSAWARLRSRRPQVWGACAQPWCGKAVNSVGTCLGDRLQRRVRTTVGSTGCICATCSCNQRRGRSLYRRWRSMWHYSAGHGYRTRVPFEQNGCHGCQETSQGCVTSLLTAFCLSYSMNRRRTRQW